MVNSEEVDNRIIDAVTDKLTKAGYQVKNSFDCFIITNPNIPTKK